MAGLPIANWIAGGAQGTLGIAQMIGGLTMPKPDIPDYEISEETYKNMTDAEYWSFQGMPEAQKQQFVEQSQRSGATALSRSTDRKGGLGLVSSIAQQEKDSATQMLSMDSQQRMSNLQNLFRAREVMSEAKDKEFKHDTDKVMYELGKRDEMIGAGMQNFGQSFSTFAGASGGDKVSGTAKPPASMGSSGMGGTINNGNYNVDGSGGGPTTMNVNKGFGGMGNIKGFGGF
jgi:hypothetical protein